MKKKIIFAALAAVGACAAFGWRSENCLFRDRLYHGDGVSQETRFDLDTTERFFDIIETNRFLIVEKERVLFPQLEKDSSDWIKLDEGETLELRKALDAELEELDKHLRAFIKLQRAYDFHLEQLIRQKEAMDGDGCMDAVLDKKIPSLRLEPPATVGDALEFFEVCALNCLCKNGHEGKGRIKVVACVGKELLEQPVPSMKAEQIAVRDALRLLCESVGCSFKVDSAKRTITITEKQVGDNESEAQGKLES